MNKPLQYEKPLLISYRYFSGEEAGYAAGASAEGPGGDHNLPPVFQIGVCDVSASNISN